MKKGVPCELGDFDLVVELSPEAGVQDFALTGLQAIHDVWDATEEAFSRDTAREREKENGAYRIVS